MCSLKFLKYSVICTWLVYVCLCRKENGYSIQLTVGSEATSGWSSDKSLTRGRITFTEESTHLLREKPQVWSEAIEGRHTHAHMRYIHIHTHAQATYVYTHTTYEYTHTHNTYVHTHTRVHTHTHIHAHTQTHTRTRAHTTYTFTHTHACTCKYTNTHVRACTRTHNTQTCRLVVWYKWL